MLMVEMGRFELPSRRIALQIINYKSNIRQTESKEKGDR